MLTAGQVAGLIVAFAFVILVLFLAFVLVKLGKVIDETQRLVTGITEQTVPLLGEVTHSVTQVNQELARVQAITANVQSMTGNVSALTSLFAATLGAPIVKVAAFTYGVRRAAGRRDDASVGQLVRQEIKGSRRVGR